MKSPFKTSTWLPLLVGLSLIACSKETIKEQKFNVIPQNSILIAKIGPALQKNHRKALYHEL